MCEHNIRLAAVGDNCMDVYESIHQAFPGGNPVNVAVYTRRLGGHSSYTGVVGNDQYGKIMIEALRSKGVDTSHVRTLEGNTAITKVRLVDGERVFGDYDEGVLVDFKLSDSDIDFLCTHDIVVTGLWGMVENDLHKIKARGTLIAFDFATKPEGEVLEAAIGQVDYAFFSTDEGDTSKLRNLMKQLKARGPKLVIATMSEQGSLVFDGTSFHHYGIVPCDVIDTMGAGDSYIAGFLKGLLKGEPIDRCMALGAENSSVTLEYVGAW